MLPRLHVVTDDAVLADAGFRQKAAAVLAAGGARLALHVRGHATSGARLFALADGLRSAASASGAMLIVNDRVDVALAIGADGVQLGRASLSLPDARALLPAGCVAGYSAHTADEAASAAQNGADLVLVGTIWETTSHPGIAGAGPALLAATVALTAVALIGIGGVTPERIAALAGAGAHGAAVLGGVWHAAEPGHATQQYLNAIAEAYATVKE